MFQWTDDESVIFIRQFSLMADLLRASGGERVPIHPSEPSEPLSADLYESESDCLSIT